MQAKQSAEILELKKALANETANVESERSAKLEASTERLIDWEIWSGESLSMSKLVYK